MQSLDLHLDRPAVIAILHSQPFERVAPDRAERAEVGVAKSETPTYQRRRQPIAPTLLRCERGARRAIQRPRAEREVGAAFDQRKNEEANIFGVIAEVRVQKNDDLRLRPERGDSRQTSCAIAPL